MTWGDERAGGDSNKDQLKNVHAIQIIATDVAAFASTQDDGSVAWGDDTYVGEFAAILQHGFVVTWVLQTHAVTYCHPVQDLHNHLRGSKPKFTFC